MAKYSTTLHLIASKLGLNEEDNFNVLSKAAEFERLLQMNSTANSNISDSSKIVICLDLAAAFFGVNLDVKAAIKYSGLKPSIYTSSKKVVENLLDLNSDKITVSMLCASLQCGGVQELAEKILHVYQKKAHVEVDLHLPQYVCMAVRQACRISKVKVQKNKLVDKSRLKPAQWSKLDAEWSKFVDENFAAAKKKSRQSKNTKDEIEEMEVDCPKTEEDQPAEPHIEPFEDWKRRILDNAYKVLRERELKEAANKQDHTSRSDIEKNVSDKSESNKKLSMTPRRSPRKTPQKFEPYKSPSKAKGVRLLFPSNF